MKVEKMRPCPECGSKKIKIENSETICKKCGLIVEEGFFSGKRLLV